MNKPDFHTYFTPEIEAQLAQTERTNFWFVMRRKLIRWALERYAPNASSFLEIGCGSGITAIDLAENNPRLQVTATDPFKNRFSASTCPDNFQFFRAEASNLSLRRRYSAAGAFDVIEHIEDDVHCLRGLNSALEHGGMLFLIVPQHQWLWSDTDTLVGHYRRYSLDMLKACLDASGFEITRHSSFIFFLLPLMVLSRIAMKIRPDTYSSRRFPGLTLPTAINRLFGLITSLEYWLILRGVTLPIGGSLLVVAKKVRSATEKAPGRE